MSLGKLHPTHGEVLLNAGTETKEVTFDQLDVIARVVLREDGEGHGLTLG
jgi:hypothetical protein